MVRAAAQVTSGNFFKVSSKFATLPTGGSALGRTSAVRSRFASLTSSLLICGAMILALPSAAQASTWPVPARGEAAPDATSLTLSLDDFETAVMVSINKVRVAHGRRPIPLFDSCTDRLAERWGRHISSTGVFAHRNQKQVIRRCHTSWAGETLVRGTQLTPKSMVDLWMGSPSHREIVLSTRARHAGVAVVPDAQGRLIGVLNLTRP